MEQAKKVLDLTVSVTIILAFIVAFPSVLLYISGLAYDYAYLDYWGVSPSLFFPSSDWIKLAELTVGAYAISSLIPSFKIMLLLLAGSCVLLIIATKVKRYFQRKSRVEEEKKGVANSENASVLAGLGLLILLIMLLSTVYAAAKLIILATNEGRKYAEETHKDIIDPAKQRSTIKLEKPLAGKDELSGYVLRCSSSHCLIFSEETVHVIPLSAISYITQQKSK
jgi:hypothetical protein